MVCNKLYSYGETPDKKAYGTMTCNFVSIYNIVGIIGVLFDCAPKDVPARLVNNQFKGKLDFYISARNFNCLHVSIRGWLQSTKQY